MIKYGHKSNQMHKELMGFKNDIYVFKAFGSHWQTGTKGDLHIDADLVRKLLGESQDGMIHITVAGWNKTIAGKECISMAASEPYVKREKVEEDVPF
jgi:hypothetical protein